MDAVDKDAFDKVGQTAEGRILQWDDESKINPGLLKMFEHPSPYQYIKTVTHEFSAVCPFSGLPDLATIVIEYHPLNMLAVELKSLKYYLLSFRNVGIYQEGVNKRIFEDLRSALHMTANNSRLSLRVTSHYHVRGGFYTTAVDGVLQFDPPIGIIYPDKF